MSKKLSIAAIIATLLCAPVHAQNKQPNKLPEIGTAGSSVLTVEKEQVIGQVIKMQMRSQRQALTDPLIDEYINDLGNKLVRNANDVRYGFTFIVMQDPDINAFALFGGVIGMNTGTILASDTESELASVIGHEIAHVTQRHLARSVEDRQRNAPLTTAGMIGSLLLAIFNPQAGMAGLQTTMAGGQQMSINYTRSNEQEADRIGIAILANAGFDPMGAPGFFSKLAERYRYTSKPPQMLLTHPLPESRISEARVRAEQFNSVYLAPSLSFYLAQSRVRIRFDRSLNDDDSLQLVKNNLKKKRYVIKEAEEYALALAYFELKRYKEAKEIIDELLAKYPKNLFFIDTYTDIMQSLETPEPAIKKLAEMYALMPNNQVVTLNYASILLSNDKPDQVIDILKRFIVAKGDNMLAFDMLIGAYQQKSEKINVHEYKGERLAFVGGFQQAIDEFQTALQYAADAKQDIASDRLKARIMQVREKEQRISRLKI